MKTALITGATSGIGRATARVLAKNNYKIVLCGRREDRILELQKELSEVTQVHTLLFDVRDKKAVFDSIASLPESFSSIDVLINNAGMGISGTIEDTSSEDAAYLFNVNFMGVFNSTKAVLPFMRESGGGKIINVSSVAARLSIPFQAFYSSSKAAINSFSEALANEVAPFNIQVCAMMPGDIKTGFTKNRKKNETDSPEYQGRVDLSVNVMENDERNGMDPESAAKVVARLVRIRKMPLYKTIGLKYKLIVLLAKILPAKLANTIVGSIYAFKKGK